MVIKYRNEILHVKKEEIDIKALKGYRENEIYFMILIRYNLGGSEKKIEIEFGADECLRDQVFSKIFNMVCSGGIDVDEI